MINIKKQIVETLLTELISKEFVVNNGNYIHFISISDTNLAEGEILIDNIKRGVFQISFSKKLVLVLKLYDNSFFMNFSDRESNIMIIEGRDIKEVLDGITKLKVKFIS